MSKNYQKFNTENGIDRDLSLNGMKKYITFLSIFIISFFFTTNSYAIILENMPTSTKSVQPIPESVTSNISNNFDINTYNLIKQTKEKNLSKEEINNDNLILNSEIVPTQNFLITKNTNQIIWYLVIFIVIFITYIIFKKYKIK
jgi:hypothetical protein